MKQVFAIGLLVNAALLAGVLLKKEVVVHAAGGGGGVPVGNGDVNGDGLIDISDAVYLLSNLFTGGPAVKPIECPAPAKGSLPATGQTRCYDAGGSVIDCGIVDFQGQDGFYHAGCPSEGRFVDNKDGTVTDTCTGLMWQKDTADVNGDGKIDDLHRLNWQDALKYCENLGSGWRLPNVRELQSIVDYGRFGPAIDPVFGAVSDWYWSSSTLVFSPAIAWYVNFYGGGVNYTLGVALGKGLQNFVRAVRNAP